MRGLLLLCACVASQNVAEYAFSGFFASGEPQLSYISGTGVDCQTSSSSYYFTTINYTFATAGVRSLYSYSLDYVSVFQSAKAVNFTDQCLGGNVWPLDRRDTLPISYVYQYAHYFEATEYTFIVYSSRSGPFTGEIWAGIQGQTALSAPPTPNKTWVPMTGSAESCSQSGSPELYDSKVVTLTASGYYNVFVSFAQNFDLEVAAQVPPYYGASFSILRGNYSDFDLNTLDCLTTNFTAYDQGEYQQVQSFYIWLNATTYTFVVQAGTLGPYSTYWGNYSLVVTPATYKEFSSVLTFNVPSSCAIGPPSCTTATRETEYAYAKVNVSIDSYVMFWGKELFSQDLKFFVYSGDNVLLSQCGGVTSQCVASEDYLESDVFYTGTSTTFTVIATGWSQSYSGSGVLALYTLTGPRVGGASFTLSPTPSTTSAPSAAPSAPTTSFPTAGPTAPTPKSNGTSANGTSAPSKAPSTKASTDVSGVSFIHPCLFTLCSLIGLVW
jgi:hypothetical protein